MPLVTPSWGIGTGLAQTGPPYLRVLIGVGLALLAGGAALLGTVLALGRRRGH